MSTSHSSVLVPEIPSPKRVPLRLRMTDRPGEDEMAGAWWPQTRELAVELADLVDHFPARSGRVVRVLVSPPDWESTPRVVPVAGRLVKVGAFPRDDTHLIVIDTSDRRTLNVLVVPPGFTPDDGDEALRASLESWADPAVDEVLRQVSGSDDLNPAERWSDDGPSGRHA